MSHVALLKRAKKDAWARDLSAKVRKALSTQLVSAEVSTATPATERADVEAAAAQVVSLVREHRRDISEQRGLVDVLKAQLQEAIVNRELIELAIEEENEVDSDAPGYVKAHAEAKPRPILRAVSLTGHKRRPVLNQVRRVVRTGTRVRQLRTDGRRSCAPPLVAVPDGRTLPSPSELLGPSGS